MSQKDIGERDARRACRDPKARECLLSPRNSKTPSMAGVEELKRREEEVRSDRGPDRSY